MLLEYADRGSLEQAIQNRRFMRKPDRSQLDMVRAPLVITQAYICCMNQQTKLGMAIGRTGCFGCHAPVRSSTQMGSQLSAPLNSS